MPKFKQKATIRGLMIQRREGQKVTVNHGEIVIEVVEVRGKYVRLCFQASKEIVIQREFHPTKEEGPNEND
jgi:sRNA-binding carbon storage regulator CsrA